MKTFKLQTNKRAVVAAIASLASAYAASLAMAQTAPTPGDLSRQLEPARPSVLPELQLQPPRLKQPSAPAAGAQVTRVQRWRVQGNSVLSDAELQALLQPFTNVDVSLPQIREAAAVVQQAYEDAGWLARVDVPAQDITEGSVTLQVTESRLGRVNFDANATGLVDRERVQAVVLAHQREGQPIYLPELNRALLLADDMNGISVVGSLQPGAQPGTTDVVLNSTAQPPYSLDLSLDNTNARAVGAHKLTAAAGWVSPSGLGEAYSAQAFVSEGAEFVRVGASAPVPGVWGSRGLKASVYFSHMNYEIVTPDGDGKKQDISGKSQTAGVDLNYPLVRTRQSNLYLTVGLEERRYRGQANGQANSHYQVSGEQAGLSGNFFDGLGGGAATTYGLTWRTGRVGASQLKDVENTDVQGRYRKFNWNLSRQQTLTSSLSLYVAVQGQNTGRKLLDSSENMSLGGVSGVRAYPSGEASAPQGQLTNLELRWRLSPEWLITPFYDHGRIQKRKADTNTAYSLEGAGVSVTWTAPAGWTARAIYARRLGDNPNANKDNGKDNDGSLTKDRLWFTLSRSF